MREIINLQVGQCGNQIGTQFWELIANEHGIEQNGLYKGDVRDPIERPIVYFNETKENRYVARSVQVDLDPASNDAILASPLVQLFNPDNFISGFGGTGNNWARGHYSDGVEIFDRALEAVRKETEKSDSLQGFQISHSLGGGTGSGLGMLLIQTIKEEFTDRIMMTFSVFPSPKVSENILEPYNAMLSIYELSMNIDHCFALDNEALQNICQRQLRLARPTYQDMNHVIAQSMSRVTSSFRYRGQLYSGLSNLAVNLVPFPTMNFHMISQAPLITKGQTKPVSLNILEMTQQIYSPESILCSAADPRNGKYLAGAVLFRGKIATVELDEQMSKLQKGNQSQFVEWIPNNLKYSITDIAPKGLKSSVTFIGNSTAVVKIFSKIQDKYQPLYKRQAFLSKYIVEGMKGNIFEYASEHVDHLNSQYLKYQDLNVDSDSEN